MPIKKSIPSSYGVAAECWVVKTIRLDVIKREATVGLLGYVSEESFKAGMAPLDSRECSFCDPIFSKYLMNEETMKRVEELVEISSELCGNEGAVKS